MIQTPDMAGAAADTVAEVVQEKIKLIDVLSEASDSWYILIPLLLMSIYAIYIFVERLMTLRKADKEEEQFMDRIKDYVHDGKLDSAKSLCASTDSPVARMVEKGVSRIGKPMQDIKASIENVGKLEISRLENNLSSLATISGIAPMLGFLGTVIGMIQVFYNLKTAGISGDFLSKLSGGIMTAMVTTVAGLIVGIMAYFFYDVYAGE